MPFCVSSFFQGDAAFFGPLYCSLTVGDEGTIEITEVLEGVHIGEEFTLRTNFFRNIKGQSIVIHFNAFADMFEVTEKFDFAELDVVLSAGSSDNVNPNLLISAFENRFLVSCDTDITRNDLYNADMELFR